jgi:tyrosine-protein phosphatase SIW14
MSEARSLTCPTRNARPGCKGFAKGLAAVFVCTLVAASMLRVAEATPPKADSAPAEKHEPARKLRLRGVAQFGQVTPTLYRGAQPSKEGFANLHKLGVNIVVDLRGSRASERELVNRLGMKYVAIPWHCFSPRDEHFAKFLKLLRDNPGKKVFVHCRLGDDRTGMEIAAYRMAEQGWTAEEARREMEVFGVNWFHKSICPRLGPYEKTFPERFRTSPAFRDLRLDKDAHPPKP